MGHSCLGCYVLCFVWMRGSQVFWLLVSHTLQGKVLPPLGPTGCHESVVVVTLYSQSKRGVLGGDPWFSAQLTAVDVVGFVIEPGEKIQEMISQLCCPRVQSRAECGGWWRALWRGGTWPRTQGQETGLRVRVQQGSDSQATTPAHGRLGLSAGAARASASPKSVCVLTVSLALKLLHVGDFFKTLILPNYSKPQLPTVSLNLEIIQSWWYSTS